MKSRDQTIREYVLEAMANSLEDFEMILSEVVKWASERGIAVDRRLAQSFSSACR